LRFSPESIVLKKLDLAELYQVGARALKQAVMPSRKETKQLIK